MHWVMIMIFDQPCEQAKFISSKTGGTLMDDVTQAGFHKKINSLELIHSGKVRDSYAVDDQHMLMVASDRLSAFDVILPDLIPGKGRVLTAVSNFWLARTRGIIRNHLSELTVDEVVADAEERRVLTGRSVVVKRLTPLPVEAIVRGYIIGSAWEQYRQTGAICGMTLPSGLRQAQRLPETIFTPSTKAAVGDHDEAMSFEKMTDMIGAALAERIRQASLRIYAESAGYALQRGIIIADTKFEFGLDEDKELVLMDEVLTPDSSRFWPVDSYRMDMSPACLDKQYVRDYLQTLDWDKTAPGPNLPQQVLHQTAAKYREVERRLIA